jgi:hypothetical protein
MDHDLSTSSTPTMSLEECDAAFIEGVFLIKDAVLNYAKHGLTSKAIHERVRALGATEGASTIRRWVTAFRAEKLLDEKTLSQQPEAVRQRAHRERVTNAQNEQMSQPTPEPAPLVTCEDPEDITFAAQRIDTDALDRAAVEFVLRDYGRWDNQMGFFPDPPLALIQKHLNELNLNELKILQKDIASLINSAEVIDI